MGSREKPILQRNFGAPAGIALLLWICLLAGCESKTRVPGMAPAAYKVRNVSGDARLPAYLQRVVLLPVWGGLAAPPESAAALDPVFLSELEKQMRFEVVPLSRDECRRRFGDEALSSASALPADFLTQISRDFGAQGVLFVDITVFRAYRPLAIGVRAKLADAREGRLIWTVDEVFSADNPAVVSGLDAYYGGQPDKGAIPENLPEAAMQSPAGFGAYAANTVFKTLPPR